MAPQDIHKPRTSDSELPFYMQQTEYDAMLPPEDGPHSSARGVRRSNIRRIRTRGKLLKGQEEIDAKLANMGTTPAEDKIDYTSYTSIGRRLSCSARLKRDGTITMSLDLDESLSDLPPDYTRDVQESGVDEKEWSKFPGPMSIVIMIVGSRGDLQPYLALGKRLVHQGHRVRIASHGSFRSFVNDVGGGLEFFDIGGNPQELMSYMVKNPGLIPGIASLTNGDIGRKRKMLAEILEGCWKACHSPCPETGRTFAADAIISNPPAFAHIHCAEALGIPLLMSFTMPWSPTTTFPHPLVNIKNSNARKGLTNYFSYTLAKILTCQGIGDLVNKFRTKSLGLLPLSMRSGPGLVDTLQVPWTYCMSPALVPKPDDWRNNIDVVGFYFLDLATNYTPPDELARFLADGKPPVYIGFGSVVVDDPETMTKIIFQATAQAGVRALVSAGWGGLGGLSVPPHVFILGNIPHDWLFDKGRVSAVVHHGGAGTTAAGLSKGLPTAVVPFFGDQLFWGNMIHQAGAGPAPIPRKKLNIDNLREAIKFVMGPSAKAAARRMAEQIHNEDGVTKGIESFYRHLPLKNMRCDLDPSRVAVWWSKDYCLKLSAFAAQTLVDANEINPCDLDLHRSKEYQTRKLNDSAHGETGAFWTTTHHYGDKILSSFYEGFHSAPKLFGTEVREPGPVENLSSGLKEAGKGLFYGCYDGITGLVKEPIKGAKKEGFKGAVKGSARSIVGATMLPAAGLVGIVTHPIQGAWKALLSAGKGTDKAQEWESFQTRILEGNEAIRTSHSWERDEIIRLFNEAKAGTEERKRKLNEDEERLMRHEAVKDEGATSTLGSSVSCSSEVDTRPQYEPTTRSRWDPTSQPLLTSIDEDEAEIHYQRNNFSSPTLVDTPRRFADDHFSPADDEAELALQRDLELARQLSTSTLGDSLRAGTSRFSSSSSSDDEAEIAFQRDVQLAKRLSSGSAPAESPSSSARFSTSGRPAYQHWVPAQVILADAFSSDFDSSKNSPSGEDVPAYH